MHAVGAACVTVNGLPAIVMVAVRLAVPVFASTAKLTEPPPEPEAPVTMVTQEAVLELDHAQPADVVTDADPAPPPLAND